MFRTLVIFLLLATITACEKQENIQNPVTQEGLNQRLKASMAGIWLSEKSDLTQQSNDEIVFNRQKQIPDWTGILPCSPLTPKPLELEILTKIDSLGNFKTYQKLTHQNIFRKIITCLQPTQEGQTNQEDSSEIIEFGTIKGRIEVLSSEQFKITIIESDDESYRESQQREFIKFLKGIWQSKEETLYNILERGDITLKRQLDEVDPWDDLSECPQQDDPDNQDRNPDPNKNLKATTRVSADENGEYKTLTKIKSIFGSCLKIGPTGDILDLIQNDNEEESRVEFINQNEFKLFLDMEDSDQ